jgi:hypothetical protein
LVTPEIDTTFFIPLEGERVGTRGDPPAESGILPFHDKKSPRNAQILVHGLKKDRARMWFF